MKNLILNEISKHPYGIRMRYLLHLTQGNRTKMINYLWELEEENKIECIYYRDMANMENYNLWKIST